MPTESHSYIGPILLLAVLVLVIVAGEQALTQARGEQAASQTGCAGQHEEKQASRADWGWNVFDNGSGSPTYRL